MRQTCIILSCAFAMTLAGVATAFIDPKGYEDYVTDREQAFRKELAKQRQGTQ